MQDNHSQLEWLTSASNDSSRVGSCTSKVCNLWPVRTIFKIHQNFTCAWMMEVCTHWLDRWEKAYETYTTSERWKNEQTQDIKEQLYPTALFSALPLVKGTQAHKTHLLLIKWERNVKRDRTLLCGRHANTVPPITALLTNCSRSLSEEWSESLSSQFLWPKRRVLSATTKISTKHINQEKFQAYSGK